MRKEFPRVINKKDSERIAWEIFIRIFYVIPNVTTKSILTGITEKEKQMWRNSNSWNSRIKKYQKKIKNNAW